MGEWRTDGTQSRVGAAGERSWVRERGWLWWPRKVLVLEAAWSLGAGAGAAVAAAGGERRSRGAAGRRCRFVTGRSSRAARLGSHSVRPRVALGGGAGVGTVLVASSARAGVGAVVPGGIGNGIEAVASPGIRAGVIAGVGAGASTREGAAVSAGVGATGCAGVAAGAGVASSFSVLHCASGMTTCDSTKRTCRWRAGWHGRCPS